MRPNILYPGLLLVLLILVGFFFRMNRARWVESDDFHRNIKYLDYTSHARCRMDCRQISEGEVMDILRNGTINPAKSNTTDRPCPTFAIEGYTQQDHQHVRIVFAQCETITRVITCIDLDKDFTCHCK